MPTPPLPSPDFAAHRRALLAALEPDEAVLVVSGRAPLRNGDADYRFRPDSDVFWMTGCDHPDTVVFLRPGEHPLTLFVQPRDPERERWDGERPGPEGAIDRYGADQAFVVGELEAELPRLLQGVRALHYAFARDPDLDGVVMASTHKAARAARRNGLSAPETFHHPSKVVHELRLRKSAAELAVMRHAATISVEAHRRAMAATRPGRYEFEIEAEIVASLRRRGSTGAGYTPIVAAGPNATVLHYVTNDAELEAGQLLLVDAGGETRWYTADITRTWPISGRFDDRQRAAYEVVLDAQRAAIAAVRPGATLDHVHDAAVERLVDGMIALGLLVGPAADRIEDQSFKRFYPHGTSHWLGLDVHDVGAYGRGGELRPLDAGMVLTVEPGLYVARDDAEAPAEWRGLGIRIEDDVLVTATGHEVLTGALERAPADLEMLVGSA